MWEASSSEASRWEMSGIDEVSPLETPISVGIRRTLTMSFVCLLRATTRSGWTTRWMAELCRTSSAVTESTRNGMSSVTT